MIISGYGTLGIVLLGSGQKGRFRVTVNTLKRHYTQHTKHTQCSIGHFANTFQIVPPVHGQNEESMVHPHLYEIATTQKLSQMTSVSAFGPES